MIPHNRPTLGPEESEAAARVIASAWLAQGREVAAFEDEICAQLGVSEGHAVALSSGSAALFLALRALGAQASKVACPVYSCSALANAIELAGASPHFIDTAPGSPNIDPGALSRTVTPFAIVPHMFGVPVDIARATAQGIVVIEDCAQAIGASFGGSPVGLQGDAAVFSFYATKMITSGGQGGMFVSKDRGIADAVRDYREFDCRRDRKPRFNFQMTDVQAAIGRTQLKKLPAFVARREEIFAHYRRAGFALVEAPAAGAARYRAVIRVKDPHALIEQLGRDGIKAIVPVEDWELLAPAENFANAAAFARTSLSLPVFPSLSDADVARIVDSVGRTVAAAALS